MSSPVQVERPPTNLTLDASKPKAKVTFNEASISSSQKAAAIPCTPPPPQRKHRYDPDYRSRRKRAHSCSFPYDHFNAKRRRSGSTIVLPTKFLLGGNITDPLNLEALDKGDFNKNDEDILSGGCRGGGTVRVIIPPNINDPLNLDACSEDGDEQLADAILRQRRRRKSRKRKRRNSEPGGMTYESLMDKRLSTSLDEDNPSTLPPIISVGQPPSTSDQKDDSPLPLLPQLNDPANLQRTNDSLPSCSLLQQQASRIAPIKKPRPKGENKIVSPVVPQPGVERKRHSSYQRQSSEKVVNLAHSNLKPPEKFNPKNSQFQYGNYNQYYGYRNPEHKTDPRLKYLKVEWFEGKEILDIGCNIGHITLTIGRDFAPQRVVGIDIDKKLVNIAKKNIKYYMQEDASAESDFPKSMKLLYGPLRPPLGKDGLRKFPHNVSFCQSNYVMENDALLETVRPEFDAVLCLSVTKWIHLNWGDEGLKRFFRRIFRNLRPGGVLILEPQAWPSYTKKRKLTAQIFENYINIRLLPDKFGDFLTKEVGFTFIQKISVPQHFSRGFQRPMYIYKKMSRERKQEIKSSAVGASGSTELKAIDEVVACSPCKQKLLSSASVELASSESVLSSSALSLESFGTSSQNEGEAVSPSVAELAKDSLVVSENLSVLETENTENLLSRKTNVECINLNKLLNVEVPKVEFNPPTLIRNEAAICIPFNCKTVNPVSSDSKANLPVSSNNEAVVPISANSEAVVPVSSNSEAIVPVSSNSEAIVPVSSNSEAVVPVSSNSEAVVPVSSNSEAVVPVSSNSEAVVPVSSNSEAVVPVSSNSETVVPVSSNSEAVVPVFSNSEAVVPASSNSEPVVSVSSNSEAVVPASSNSEAVVSVSSNSEAIVLTSANSEAVVPFSSNSEAVVPVSSNSEAVVPALANSETIVSAPANSEAIVPVSSNSEAVVPVSSNSEAVVHVSSNSETVVSVSSNSEAVVAISSNSEAVVPVPASSDFKSKSNSYPCSGSQLQIIP